MEQSVENLKRIAVIGTGLLGASLGLALRGVGWAGRRVGVGRRAGTLDAAMRIGAFDESTTDIAAGVADADLVVIATPLGAFGHVLGVLADAADADTVITDVGSTKTQVCDVASKVLPTPARFVGGHPMAGSEQQGPEHAKAGLYDGALCILTPEGTDADDDAVQCVSGLWKAVGMTLTRKTPAEHDRLVATISHLPHAVASLLVKLADQQRAISVASTGFRDTTRIASGDPTVWRDIFVTNREALLETLDKFTENVAAFRGMIEAGDSDALTQLLDTQKRNRDKWLSDRGWDQ